MSEEEEGEEVEGPPRATTPFPTSSSGATPKPQQSHLDATAPMDAATPGATTPIPVITHTSPEAEMEEGEEGEEQEGGDVDLVDAPPPKVEEKALVEKMEADEEEGEEGGEGGEDKMDVS